MVRCDSVVPRIPSSDCLAEYRLASARVSSSCRFRLSVGKLAIPKLRRGSYFPSFLEPRRRAEQALVAVVQEAYVNGVSTRKVDRLVEQLGLHHLSKDQVSRLCRGLDEQVRVFRERPLEGGYPYLWLDAKVERVREAGWGPPQGPGDRLRRPRDWPP